MRVMPADLLVTPGRGDPPRSLLCSRCLRESVLLSGARNLLFVVIPAQAGIQFQERFLFARRLKRPSSLARPNALRSEAPRPVRHEHARRARSTETGLAWLWSTRSARARATHCPCAPEG